MKHLYLVRHAKASRSEIGTGDFERPLLPQGVQAAQPMGECMARMAHPPGFGSLFSGSARARNVAVYGSPS